MSNLQDTISKNNPSTCLFSHENLPILFLYFGAFSAIVFSVIGSVCSFISMILRIGVDETETTGTAEETPKARKIMPFLYGASLSTYGLIITVRILTIKSSTLTFDNAVSCLVSGLLIGLANLAVGIGMGKVPFPWEPGMLNGRFMFYTIILVFLNSFSIYALIASILMLSHRG